MDRDDRLRAAREKLKKFQKKKQTVDGSPNQVVEIQEEVQNGNSEQAPPNVENNDNPSPNVLSAGGEVNKDVSPPSVSNTHSRSISSSSLSNQISSVLASSTAHLVDDGDDQELLILRARVAQLEKEKSDMVLTIQKQSASLQQWEAHVETITQQYNATHAERQKKEACLASEVQNLKEQLASHADSIKILVSGRTELEQSLVACHKDLETANEENELLKSQRHQANQTQQQQLNGQPYHRTCSCTDRVFLAEVERKRLADSLSELRDEKDRIKIENIDMKQEILELKSKVEYKEKEALLIAGQLAETASKLELAEVNLAQFRSVAASVEDAEGEEGRNESLPEKSSDEALLKDKDAEVSRLAKENEEHVKRVAELTAYIQQASQDREQIIHQYTSYSQQLATQIETLTQQLNAKAVENHDFAAKEADHVAHVQRLENQLQKLMQNHNNNNNNNSKDGEDVERQQREKSVTNEAEVSILRTKAAELDKKASELQAEREELQGKQAEHEKRISELVGQLAAKTAKIGVLETQLEMSDERSSVQNLSQQESLVAASASDKLAASRAMKQNEQLKDQVEELEIAVVQVNNDKAQLMIEYDSLKANMKKLDESSAAMKAQIDGLQESVKERDRNMTRMREQMKYYIAFAENSINGNLDTGRIQQNPKEDNDKDGSVPGPSPQDFVEQLQAAQEQIRCLNSHNLELKGHIEVLSSRTCDNSSSGSTPDQDVSTSSDNSSVELAVVRPPSASTESEDSAEIENEASIPPLSRDVAALKLEQKFEQAMQRVAILTSEKEELEHLIVRLQEETDTVGEYITIYQYQRSQQKARLEEKEKQLQSMSKDKQDLMAKLEKLQSLITSFVSSDQPATNGHHAIDEQGVDASEGEKLDDVEPATNKEADQILSLISQIGSSSVLKNNSVEEFHPWFWESASGRLMTV